MYRVYNHPTVKPPNQQTVFLQTTRELLARTPLFAQLLARLPKIADQTLNAPLALGWEEQPYLRYHPILLSQLSRHADWLRTWLCEELLHLLLQHPQKQKEYPVSWAFHLAADVEVDQYLSSPENPMMYAKLVTRLHLPEYATLDMIYQAVLRLETTVPREALLPTWTASPLSRLSHPYWPNAIAASAWQTWWGTQHDLLQKYQGGDQEMLLANLAKLNNRPFLPWPTVLRRFVSSARRTQNRNSLRRPSRRFGTLPGMRRRRTTRLAVVLDTSGSISEQQRLQFFQELQKLQPLTQEILIIEADYKVRTAVVFTGEIPLYSQGGGRTAFDPALQFINTQGPFDGVIYLTDGEGPAPITTCLYPLLWIINAPQLPEIANWPGQMSLLKVDSC